MLEHGTKKFLRLGFATNRAKPRVFKAGKKISRPFGYKVTSQKQLRALRDHGVPEGACLNPHGHYGYSRRSRYRATYFKLKIKPAFREAAMKRKRVKLKIKAAIALEANELQQMARENATLAMQTLTEIARNKRAPEPSRIAASAVILDRAYGKASQTSITASVTSGKETDIDSAELDRRITSTLKKVEALTNKSPAKVRVPLKSASELKKLN